LDNYGFEVQRLTEFGRYASIGFVHGHGTTDLLRTYRFVDENPGGPGELLYRLKQIDLDGSIELSETIRCVRSAPSEFNLMQNYPNPFNSRTRIRYTLAEDVTVRIRIYTVKGEEVTTLVEKYQTAGDHSVFWNAGAAPAGIYLFRIDAGSHSAVKKCILIN
jgi:hypothetical protein